MPDARAVLFLYVETPLHAGAGAGVGAVDLPIQRERVTGYPIVNSGGVKGALRGAAVEAAGSDISAKEKVEAAFGPDTGHASDHAGALVVGDARLLLFPVRSMRGVFAWTTSRDLLHRFVRDATLAGLELPWQVPALPETSGDDEPPALVSKGSDVVAGGNVVLEEFQFEIREASEVGKIGGWLAENAVPDGAEYGYWRERLPRALVILPEDAFRDFTQYGTEIITRVQLDNETKTVRHGPWVEEHLPTDSLLYVPVQASRDRFDDAAATWKKREARAARDELQEWRDVQGGDRVMAYLGDIIDPGILQLGGDLTVGRGLVRLRLQKGK